MSKVNIKPFDFTILSGEGATHPTKSDLSDFAAFSNPNDEEKIEVTYSAAQLHESEEEGYQRGVVDGINQGRKELFELNQQINDALNVIAPKMEELFKLYVDKVNNSTKETSTLALQIAKKIAGDALGESPMAVIEPSVTKCLSFLFNEPEVNIIINETLIEECNQRMEEIVSQSQFSGKVHILGSPNIGLGDCKIEWNNGGAEISANSRIKQIEEVINLINSSDNQG